MGTFAKIFEHNGRQLLIQKMYTNSDGNHIVISVEYGNNEVLYRKIVFTGMNNMPDQYLCDMYFEKFCDDDAMKVINYIIGKYK